MSEEPEKDPSPAEAAIGMLLLVSMVIGVAFLVGTWINGAIITICPYC